MNEVQRIADQLERAYRADAWCGASLLEALAGVDTEIAAARPLPDAHSIWEIVVHAGGWKDTVRRRLEGEDIGTPMDGDWPVIDDHSDAAWMAAQQELDHRHAQLMAAVRGMTDARLHDVLSTERSRETGGGVSGYIQLHGVAQHDLYHAAQIALLKKWWPVSSSSAGSGRP